jgi:hypothetical protein
MLLILLQGDPAQRNADVFFRVPPNSVLPRHWHTSAERMILVSGELHLTFDSHQPQVARPETYIYGAAKLPHEGRCGAGTRLPREDKPGEQEQVVESWAAPASAAAPRPGRAAVPRQ